MTSENMFRIEQVTLAEKEVQTDLSIPADFIIQKVTMQQIQLSQTEHSIQPLQTPPSHQLHTDPQQSMYTPSQSNIQSTPSLSAYVQQQKHSYTPTQPQQLLHTPLQSEIEKIQSMSSHAHEYSNVQTFHIPQHSLQISNETHTEQQVEQPSCLQPDTIPSQTNTLEEISPLPATSPQPNASQHISPEQPDSLEQSPPTQNEMPKHKIITPYNASVSPISHASEQPPILKQGGSSGYNSDTEGSHTCTDTVSYAETDNQSHYDSQVEIIDIDTAASTNSPMTHTHSAHQPIRNFKMPHTAALSSEHKAKLKGILTKAIATVRENKSQLKPQSKTLILTGYISKRQKKQLLKQPQVVLTDLKAEIVKQLGKKHTTKLQKHRHTPSSTSKTDSQKHTTHVHAAVPHSSKYTVNQQIERNKRKRKPSVPSVTSTTIYERTYYSFNSDDDDLAVKHHKKE